MDRVDVAAWCGIVALGVALEIRELREGPQGVPLSRILRSVFRTEHPLGAAAFRTAVAAGGVILVRHICTPHPSKEGPA